jgi:hypothetical protein
VLWLAWLVAFVVLEVVSARSSRPKPRTFSEQLWRWFKRGWRRAVLVGLLSLLTWHLLSGPDLGPLVPIAEGP